MDWARADTDPLVSRAKARQQDDRMRVILGSFRWNSSDEVDVNLNLNGLSEPPSPANRWQLLETKGFKRLGNEFYSTRLQFGTGNIHRLKRSLLIRLAKSRDI